MIDRAERLRKLVLTVARMSGAAPAARPFLGGIGVILMLHRVSAAPPRPLGMNSHLTITPAFLDAVIADMKKQNYAFVSMDEAVDRIRQGGGGRFAALSADDGYRDNLTEALPVLERHGAPIAIHVAPGLIDGAADLWWDVVEEIVSLRDHVEAEVAGRNIRFECSTRAAKIEAFCRIAALLTEDVPEEGQREALGALARAASVDQDAIRRSSLMDWDELRLIARHELVTIGAHTVHHFNLKRLPEAQALSEIERAGPRIAERIGVEPRHMAFPYGYPAAVGEREVRLAAEAGYVSAVTTRHGVLLPRHAAHLTALPRLSLNGRYQSLGHVRTMLSGLTTPLANAGRRLVTV